MKKPVQIKREKYFPNMAKLTFNYRESMQMSQNQLSALLGFKNGQYISNIERGICSVPKKKAKVFCEILGVDVSLFIATYLADEQLYIKGAFND